MPSKERLDATVTGVKLSEAAKYMEVCIKAGLSIMLEGAPGAGKSSVVRQVAKKLGMKLIDLRLSLLNPVDLRGIPMATRDGKTAWLSPTFLPDSGSGILFLDEVNVAPPSTQAAGYQLTLDHECGEYKLPCRCHHPDLIRGDGPGWSVVCAGNRDSDKALVYQMPSALRSRLALVDIKVDLSDWITWAFDNEVASQVIAYNKWKEGAVLFNFDPEKHTKAFCSPRSWERVSKVLKVIGERKSQEYLPLLAGILGSGEAVSFVAFCDIADKLPDVDKILDGDLNIRPPAENTETGVLYAMTGALVTKTLAKDKKDLEKAARNLVAYTTKQFSSEFAVLTVKDLLGSTKLQTEGVSTRLFKSEEFIGWKKKFGGVITEC